MRQSQKILEVTDIYIYRRYLKQMLTVMGVLLFSLFSGSAFAFVPAPNPGANCNSIDGASKDSLTNNDYDKLVLAVNKNEYVTVAGNASGSIPLQIKMSTSESSTGTSLSNFGVIESDGFKAINVRRTFPNTNEYTDVSLDFRNSITGQALYLTNVALSTFDIDYSNFTNNRFDDNVQITGINQGGNRVYGNFQQTNNTNVRYYNGSDPRYKTGLYTTDGFNCTAKTFSNECQGSVQFSEPVTSIRIRYTNFGRLSQATNQEIDFRVDNYCYVPEYVFSGTVFNDNGGILDAQADANNANINRGTYFNKPNYFNGIFNPPQESGLSLGTDGSTVRLANCDNTGTTYTTQSVIKSGAPVGEYQISVPKTTLASNTNLCLVETRSGNSYPIRTTNESKNVGFVATTYTYPNNNFGRVIAANAALVLRKAQFVNDCPSTLDYTASTLNTPGNTNPRTGFSESSISGSELIPGQCIAYRITATNRSNLVINDFVMQDKLQKKGVEGALVTSVLVGPLHNSSDYALNSVAIDQNNPVITEPLVLPARDNKVFYFNTKYGTTVDP